MQKDFDAWNTKKKSLNSLVVTPFYKEREIWWCALGTNIGFEQDGTGVGRSRPVIIIKGFSRNVCLVVPLTTSHKNNPYYKSIGIFGGKESFAIISQIRLIDTKRLIVRIGLMEKIEFSHMKKAIRNLI